MALKCLAGGIALGLALASPARAATSYEVSLPAQLSSDPDLCAYAPCKEVMPEVERFSARKGTPPYVEAYRDGDKLAGYVFLSTDIVDIPAYSGKPIVTLIGMDTRGFITGVKILKHSEPILLVGIPEERLTRFIGQYAGRSAGERVEIGKARPGDGYVGIDAISGATVTVIAENQVVMRSVYAIARQVGIIRAVAKPQAKLVDLPATLDWEALVDEGSVERLVVEPSDVGEPVGAEPYIDMHFGYLNAPVVGRSILGEQGWRRLMADLKPGEHAIFVIASGRASFKGSGFVRGGIYDRIQLAQDPDSFTFRDTDYANLYRIEAAGAPQFRESGIFVLRNTAFSAAYPWSLRFLSGTVDRATGVRSFVNFEADYWLPERYLEGGRPRIERAEAVWMRVWKGKRAEIAALVLLLSAAVAAYALRDRLARRSTRKDKRWIEAPKYAVWAASLGFAGAYAMAQPSITQVLTWFHAIFFEWKWELFLTDPLIFIFWWAIIGTVLVWGRGLFCGWLCPYGALTELLHRLAGAIGLKRFQFKLRQSWHDRLKWVKYGIFVFLVGASFYSMELAEKLAEVEPFKSTFLVGGAWNRPWPFVAYWSALLVAAVFMERPFCKYLCPLGAGLAIPSTFRFFGLKRKAECLTCHACQAGCSSLAIDDDGRIDQRECLQCLECQVLYYDDHACPPLAKERRARAKLGLPLTPIGADGYYIPIKPEASGGARPGGEAK
jgi:NosR/NirI family nitrous oxide reductase transcriptional regulator